MEDENVREKERIKRMISPLDPFFLKVFQLGEAFPKNPKFILFRFAEITDSDFVGSHLKYFAVRQYFGALLVLQIF